MEVLFCGVFGLTDDGIQGFLGDFAICDLRCVFVFLCLFGGTGQERGMGLPGQPRHLCRKEKAFHLPHLRQEGLGDDLPSFAFRRGIARNIYCEFALS